MVFYINDYLILYYKRDSTLREQISRALLIRYKVKDLGDIESFLKVRIIRDRTRRKVTLLYDEYIEKVAHRFEIDKRTLFLITPLLVKKMPKRKG